MKNQTNLFDLNRPYSERSIAIACTRGRQAVVSHFQSLLAEAQLSEQQWRVMRILEDFEPLSITELCEKSCIHKVSMTRIIRNLTERDLIHIRKNPNDQRSFDVGLTVAGRAFLDRTTPLANEISSKIIERLGQKKATQLMALLNELAQLRAV